MRSSQGKSAPGGLSRSVVTHAKKKSTTALSLKRPGWSRASMSASAGGAAGNSHVALRPGKLATLALLAPFALTGCVPSEDGFSGIESLGGTLALPTASLVQSDTLAGRVERAGDYDLFDIGPVGTGDVWQIGAADLLPQTAVVVALFDQDYNLLQRAFLNGNVTLNHMIRYETGNLIVGVMAPPGARGDYRLALRQGATQSPPAPQPALVWLNFSGATGLRVNSRSGQSFGPFDAAQLGPAYAGMTAHVKAAILEAVRADYAEYNVTILSSDEAPAPEAPHSTIHFGGYDPGLLGLADSVDEYNATPSQNAVIYVQTFEGFSVMRLSAEEMGLMIANVTSHELGHLLGLYHTSQPDDVMDTTGSAWDLASNQAFRRASLESSVFATGWSDSPRRLEATVGRNPHPAARSKAPSASQLQRSIWLQQFIHGELRGRCGTCRHVETGE